MVGWSPTLHEYGSGGKSSTWGSGEAFEEDIAGNQVAVFLADEVSGMVVLHADSGGDVLEDEMVLKWAVETPDGYEP